LAVFISRMIARTKDAFLLPLWLENRIHLEKHSQRTLRAEVIRAKRTRPATMMHGLRRPGL
jgi:hypothetical protein